MPNSTCDLHLHTYYSDGSASPAGLLHNAAAIGLKTVAITDHDNTNAYPEARNVADYLGLELIPGIEFTSRWNECTTKEKHTNVQDVDILGYFFDPDDPIFQAFVRKAFNNFVDRIQQCCRSLSQAGYPVSLVHLSEENPRYPGALQLISSLWKKGLTYSEQTAYQLFQEHWPNVQPAQFSSEEVIAAIHSAGGVAILAHPVAIQCVGGYLDKELIAPLVEAGLDGLEIFHPRLDAAARQHFLEITRHYHLLVSGGSDEHGHENHLSRIGSQLVTYETVSALSERSEQIKSKRI